MHISSDLQGLSGRYKKEKQKTLHVAQLITGFMLACCPQITAVDFVIRDTVSQQMGTVTR